MTSFAMRRPVACLESFKATPNNKSLSEAQACVVELSIIHMFVSLCFIVHGCPLLYNLDTMNPSALMLLKFCACHGALMLKKTVIERKVRFINS